MISDLNDRSREVLRHLVDNYLLTGEPVGSRTLARRLSLDISPATIRNVMSDLEDLGLLFQPHTSAGRMPTDASLRLFVDGLLEIGNLTSAERDAIEERCAGSSHNMDSLMTQATTALSGLSGCASIVFAPKTESPLKHIEFVNLSPGRTLVVLVTENGIVENRIFTTPQTLPPSVLVQATNYLGSRLVGRTISEAFDEIMTELDDHQVRLDELTAKVVESGLATWAGDQRDGALIVRGQAHLLDDVTAAKDLEQIRSLFEALETKEEVLRLLRLAETAEGVQIFIGADNNLFNMAGVSMVVNSFRNTNQQVIGAIGVIGPTRMNYARIIPMVDFTANLIKRLIG
ncbi:MAG: heat-inducible transcriptional repressor HrcA [Rhodospirillales bacterium]|nr:heat-inducible transcriptional repressor HrcA [Rhodospirillales bacterium]